jgi:hypothetical protein
MTSLGVTRVGGSLDVTRCPRLDGAIDTGLLGGHQHTLATDRRRDGRLNVQESGTHENLLFLGGFHLS